MKIVVLSVGRVRQRFVLDAEGEYLQRIKGSFQVELVELGMEPLTFLLVVLLAVLTALSTPKLTFFFRHA